MSTTQRAAFALMVGLLGSCLSLPAQETQGGIQGTVKDASGGAVPNATIEISDRRCLARAKFRPILLELTGFRSFLPVTTRLQSARAALRPSNNRASTRMWDVCPAST